MPKFPRVDNCMYVCMYACMYACTFVCLYVCIHVCMYVRMYASVHACMYVYSRIKLSSLYSSLPPPQRTCKTNMKHAAPRPRRKLGTAAHLKNHRKMLIHRIKCAEEDVTEAEAAVAALSDLDVSAQDIGLRAGTAASAAYRLKAALDNRREALFKLTTLDQDDVMMLSGQEPRRLNRKESARNSLEACKKLHAEKPRERHGKPASIARSSTGIPRKKEERRQHGQNWKKEERRQHGQLASAERARRGASCAFASSTFPSGKETNRKSRSVSGSSSSSSSTSSSSTFRSGQSTRSCFRQTMAKAGSTNEALLEDILKAGEREAASASLSATASVEAANAADAAHEPVRLRSSQIQMALCLKPLGLGPNDVSTAGVAAEPKPQPKKRPLAAPPSQPQPKKRQRPEAEPEEPAQPETPIATIQLSGDRVPPTPSWHAAGSLNENYQIELAQRELRDEKIKEDLLAGNRVCYRSGGWSLYPRVWSNNRCTFEPVTSADEVSEWDIVFCQVLPRNRFFAHYVKYKYWAADQWVFTISNAKGWENGRTDIEHIYGILVNVEW